MPSFYRLLACICIFFASNHAIRAENVHLKGVSGYPRSIPFYGDFFRNAVNRIDEETNGAIKVDVFGAGELVNSSEVLDAVGEGLVDIGWSPAHYWSAKEPAFNLFTTTLFLFSAQEHIAWMQAEGTAELNAIYRDFGVVAVPCGMVSAEGGGWFSRELTEPKDLKGLKIRAFGLPSQVYESVGANRVSLPGSEIYTALQVGVIDAAEYSNPSVDIRSGFQEIASNYYYPSWSQPYTMIDLIINEGVWSDLSSDHKQKIEAACFANMNAGLEQSSLADSEALETLVSQHGTKVAKFPASVLAAIEDASGEVMSELTGSSDRARRIAALQLEFHEKYLDSPGGVRPGFVPGSNKRDPFPDDWAVTVLDTDFRVISPAYGRDRPTISGRQSVRLGLGENVHVVRQIVDPISGEVWFEVEHKGQFLYFFSKNFEPLTQEASAGARGGSVVPGAIPATTAFTPFSRKIAIVIGVSDYEHLDSASTNVGDLIDLRYAHRDAHAFAKFLKEDSRAGGGWQVLEFIGDDAKTGPIFSAIGRILGSASPTDLIYIFFSGHGVSDDYDPSQVYLMTANTDPKQPYAGLSYSELRSRVANSTAKHIVVFIDACRSGIVGFGKGENSQPAFDQDELGNRVADFREQKIIFSSGRSVQASWEDNSLEHGVFTHYLLEGLRGDAATNASPGFIDIGELVSYVTERVGDHSRNHADMAFQSPRLWAHTGVVHDKFPVALTD